MADVLKKRPRMKRLRFWNMASSTFENTADINPFALVPWAAQDHHATEISLMDKLSDRCFACEYYQTRTVQKQPRGSLSVFVRQRCNYRICRRRRHQIDQRHIDGGIGQRFRCLRQYEQRRNSIAKCFVEKDHDD